MLHATIIRRLRTTPAAGVHALCFYLFSLSLLLLAAAEAIALTARSAPMPLGDSFRIAPEASDFQDHGVVALAADRTFAAAWHGQPDGQLAVYGRFFAADTVPTTSAIRVHEPIDRINSNPALALTAQGRAIVVWSYESVPGRWQTLLRVHGAGVTMPTPFNVNAPDPGSDPEPQPDVCLFREGPYAGYFVVVWSDKDFAAARQVIMGRLFAPDGTPVGDPFLVSQFASWPSGELLANS